MSLDISFLCVCVNRKWQKKVYMFTFLVEIFLSSWTVFYRTLHLSNFLTMRHINLIVMLRLILSNLI